MRENARTMRNYSGVNFARINRLLRIRKPLAGGPSPRASSLRRLHARQHVILELLAKRDLLDLAGGGVRDFLHEHHVVRHPPFGDRKSTRLNSSHLGTSYAVFCLKKK